MKTELLRHALSYIPPRISLYLFGAKFYLMDFAHINRLLKRVKAYSNSTIVQKMDKKEKRLFIKEMRNYCIFCNHIGAEEYLDSYFEGEELRPIKISSVRKEDLTSTEPILICCIKNDLERISTITNYHRKIGIRKMVFLDNMSDDGTLEWLKTQDVDLYSINEKYHAGRKSAWIRKVMDIYGYNRWYLIVDSDELFSYIGSEEHSISDLIAYAENNNLDRIGSFLLDMYPKHNLYEQGKNQDCVIENRFFDSDSYYMSRDGRGFMLRGGPRKRVFELELDYSEPLSKYPLFFGKIEDLWSDHRPLPFYKNFNSQCLSTLRHYKFMEGDFEKYNRIALEGNYYNGSANYKIYTEGGKNISFMYENSKEYKDSQSLSCLEYIKEADW